MCANKLVVNHFKMKLPTNYECKKMTDVNELRLI